MQNYAVVLLEQQSQIKVAIRGGGSLLFILIILFNERGSFFSKDWCSVVGGQPGEVASQVLSL